MQPPPKKEPPVKEPEKKPPAGDPPPRKRERLARSARNCCRIETFFATVKI
jgi:hypothetical protein